MAMFDDPKKELAKLEAQLLKDEEWFDKELEMAKALIGDEPAQKKPAKKPAQQTAENPPRKSAMKQAETPAPRKKSNKGLVILACLETLGIVGVVVYWMMFLL